MQKKSVYINSNNRISGTNENFFISDSNRYSLPPQYVKLVSASIPYTWYSISTSNSSLSVSEPPSITQTVITIPSNNYTGTTLATALQTALNSAGLTHTYTVTYSGTTNLFTISATGNFILHFAASGSLASQLGFASNSTTTSATSVTSTMQAQFLTDYEIFICSNLVSGIDNGYAEFVSGSAINSQILAVVPIDSTPQNTIINYTNDGMNPSYNINQSLYGKLLSYGDLTPKLINFFLAFPSGNIVNLNNYHWSATLMFLWS
jgi:hypothetical protein